MFFLLISFFKKTKVLPIILYSKVFRENKSAVKIQLSSNNNAYLFLKKLSESGRIFGEFNGLVQLGEFSKFFKLQNPEPGQLFSPRSFFWNLKL